MQGSRGARPLVVLVIVLGVLILAGMAVVGTALMTRLAGGAASDGFGELALPLPEGCVLEDARAEGGHLVIRVGGLAARGCQKVLVYDLASGTLLGTVTAEPAP